MKSNIKCTIDGMSMCNRTINSKGTIKTMIKNNRNSKSNSKGNIKSTSVNMSKSKRTINSKNMVNNKSKRRRNRFLRVIVKSIVLLRCVCIRRGL